MATRTITGKVYDLLDQPIQNAKLKFSLNQSAYTTDKDYESSSSEIRTDFNGEWSIVLWCNSESLSPTSYTCTNPDGSRFIFTLDPGISTLTYSQIKAMGTPISSPPSVPSASLLTYISSQIALMGGGGSGTSLANIILPFLDDQIVFTLSVLPAQPQKTMLFINGIKYEYLDAYTLTDYVLTWLNPFLIKSNYSVQFYY